MDFVPHLLPVLAAALIATPPAGTAQQTVVFEDGSRGIVRFDKRPGANRKASPSRASAGRGLPFFTRRFSSFGTQIPLSFVGTDPSRGSATTVVPVTIIPLRFVFSSGEVLDASPIVGKTVRSPIFQPAAFATGGTHIGVTQYGDAIQRAQFWNYVKPGGVAPDYHVLLGNPLVLPAQTVTVPAEFGQAIRTRTLHVLTGRVDSSFFDARVVSELSARFDTQADTLVIFLDFNTFLYDGEPLNCCTIGFHTSSPDPKESARTWVFSAFYSPGIFSGPPDGDVLGLSHEISEWMNDPFVGALQDVNWTPPAKYDLGCLPNLETADPLEGPVPAIFTVNLGGTTYHLQDEAFVPWFLHTAPSPSVNGFYSFLGTFRTPSTLCDPG